MEKDNGYLIVKKSNQSKVGYFYFTEKEKLELEKNGFVETTENGSKQKFILIEKYNGHDLTARINILNNEEYKNIERDKSIEQYEYNLIIHNFNNRKKGTMFNKPIGEPWYSIDLSWKNIKKELKIKKWEQMEWGF